jgi:hypothetical protein
MLLGSSRFTSLYYLTCWHSDHHGMQLAAPTHVRGTITTCRNACGCMTTCQGHNVHDQQFGAAAMQVGLYADKSSGI